MWKCTGCQEKIEDSFEVCWKCGTSYDGASDPHFQSEATTSEPWPEPSRRTSKSDLACSQCGSRKIIPSAEIMDSNRQYGRSMIRIKVEREPGALFFGGPELVDLRAKVCGDCGHVELYVDEPHRLWQAYQERK